MKMKPPKMMESNFLEMINGKIAKGRNVDYLKQVLVDFDEYQFLFHDAFNLENSNKKVYTFRVHYTGKKPVWREIEVYGNQYFLELAEEIIFSMDWDNDHMHGFCLNKKGEVMFSKDSPFFYAPGWEDEPFPAYKTDEIKICHIDYEKYPKLGFIFDFGAGHQFTVEFKGTRDKNRDEYVDDFPVLVDQRGIAPEQYPDGGFEDQLSLDDLDDNCPLCRAIKDGDNSLDSLVAKFMQMEEEEKKKLPFKELG
ncbi:MAG: hypothetical protein O2871_01515 [bacterium]|nr:hypothetical protein [bacterium]